MCDRVSRAAYLLSGKVLFVRSSGAEALAQANGIYIGRIATGDQLYVDLDLSVGNLRAGSLLAVGQAVLQVSEAPHLGCAKFVEQFGAAAMRFVNSRTGRQLRLRGMYSQVVEPGIVRPGDIAAKAHPADHRSSPGTVGLWGIIAEDARGIFRRGVSPCFQFHQRVTVVVCSSCTAVITARGMLLPPCLRPST